jgi:hypothetical protein
MNGNLRGSPALSPLSEQIICLSHRRIQMLRKSLIAFAATVALGCVPLATTASAATHGGSSAGHAAGGHASANASGRAAGRSGGHAMHAGGGYGRARNGGGYNGGGYNGGGYNGYDGYYGYAGGGCPGYYGNGYNNGCPGYGVPLVGGIVNGILGGYGPF